MNLLYQLPTPIIFAHRGACAFAPENTLAAFKMAEEVGAPAVELDVKLSLDGEIVVIHDSSVDRTTGSKGWVNQMNWADLRLLDAGSFFSKVFIGEKIPLLEEVFNLLGKRLLINIELTNYASPRDALVEKTAALVTRCGMQDYILFSSFSPINLLKARGLLPGVPVGLLSSQGPEGQWARSFIARWFFPAIIHPYRTDATPVFIWSEHRRHRRVNVWTVNDPVDMKKLFQAKVDGIFTDDPALAKHVLEEG
jgi:glycerophosphoryl diester phosphodiesterase